MVFQDRYTSQHDPKRSSLRNFSWWKVSTVSSVSLFLHDILTVSVALLPSPQPNLVLCRQNRLVPIKVLISDAFVKGREHFCAVCQQMQIFFFIELPLPHILESLVKTEMLYLFFFIVASNRENPAFLQMSMQKVENIIPVYRNCELACKIVLVFWRAKCMLTDQPSSPPPKSWKASRDFEQEPVNSEEWLAAAFISSMPLSMDPAVE